MASSTAQRRLLQEYRALTNNPPEGITAGPVSEDDLLYWEALIQGPEGTPFEGGVFPAELKFPKDYPLAPPTMRFLGEVWHPNGERPSASPSLPAAYPFENQHWSWIWRLDSRKTSEVESSG
jgi:ubiquitin-protein ligase